MRTSEKMNFNFYGTVKIEVQEQPDGINTFVNYIKLCLTLLDVNSALKVIKITLAYQNDENDTHLGVAEKKYVFYEFSAPVKKKSL